MFSNSDSPSSSPLLKVDDEVTTEVQGFHAGRLDTLRARLTPPAADIDQTPAPLDIAIVGMACMLPGSPDLDSFWRTVLSGVDTVGCNAA